ncbi:MAG: hypothetical protein IJA10_10370 [Lachnospiraceae bacterium]|nr:hypothetical protein [Lachnospiraceae bacterium]
MVKVEKQIIEDVSKMNVTQCRSAYKKLAKEYDKIKDGFYCHDCGTFKPQDKFYKSIHTKSGVIPTCKECLYRIGTGYDEKNKETHETRETVIEAMKKANLPFIEDLYNSSCDAITNETSGKKRGTGYSQMIVCLQSLPQFFGLTYENSDFGDLDVNNTTTEISEKFTEKKQEVSEDIEDMYIKNKRSVLRMLGYDPFTYEEEEDKPLLYSKLVNYFDDSLKDDGFKLEAVIEIVQTFKDVKHINDTLAQYTKQLQTHPEMIATVKSLTQTKKDMLASALALAKDNGISENNNNRKSKGAGTLSGIIKELQEMNLESSEVNTFDYETNLAIEDIMTRNHQNQLRQLNPDENDWEKEVVHQKQILFRLQKERDNAVEFSRLLKKENKDLKDFLLEKGLINSKGQVIES